MLHSLLNLQPCRSDCGRSDKAENPFDLPAGKNAMGMGLSNPGRVSIAPHAVLEPVEASGLGGKWAVAEV